MYMQPGSILMGLIKPSQTPHNLQAVYVLPFPLSYLLMLRLPAVPGQHSEYCVVDRKHNGDCRSIDSGVCPERALKDPPASGTYDKDVCD